MSTDPAFPLSEAPTPPEQVAFRDELTVKDSEELPSFAVSTPKTSSGSMPEWTPEAFAHVSFNPIEETVSADAAFDEEDTESKPKRPASRPRSNFRGGSAIARSASSRVRAQSTALPRRPTARAATGVPPPQKTWLQQNWLWVLIILAASGGQIALVMAMLKARSPAAADEPPPTQTPLMRSKTALPYAQRPIERDPIDLESWLIRPGVRVVVVEFFASWCRGCVDDVGKWKRLSERYRDQGLRIIVVVTRDGEASCREPGWIADSVVCDPEGKIAKKLGVTTRLPAAHAWDWRGRILARAEKFKAVSFAVTRAIETAPRVQVAAGPIADSIDIEEDRLEDLVRAALLEQGKLELVATKAEEERLSELRRESHRERFDEKYGCKLDGALPANTLLEAEIGELSGRPHLFLKLLSAEQGCLIGSSWARFNPGAEIASVLAAVDRLMTKLRIKTEKP